MATERDHPQEATTEDSFSVGDIIDNKYHVERKLGKGGYGMITFVQPNKILAKGRQLFPHLLLKITFTLLCGIVFIKPCILAQLKSQ